MSFLKKCLKGFDDAQIKLILKQPEKKKGQIAVKH